MGSNRVSCNCSELLFGIDANLGAGALESFLTDFKTSPEHTLATALGDITIDEDDLSDDNDLMEDADDDQEAHDRRREERRQKRTPQYIYKDTLQKLANRTIEEVTIDLDDLAAVRPRLLFPHALFDILTV